MKKHLEVPRPIAIAILAIVFIFMAAVSVQAQSPQAKDHAKLQKEYSFDARLKANESFTLPSAKEDLKTAKKKKRKSNKKEKEAERLLAIRERINEIDQ